MTNQNSPAPPAPADGTADGETMIHLDGVSKRYAGTAEAAVEELTLDIPKGEVLVLVGPSGCGKSTTLRLINRMIEPSSGRIYFGGEDVTDVNADELRRRIGYVIQQIGLFPHRTIAENVATVPKLLGWPRSEIGPRVNELLEMVGLDPSVFAKRYPKELSGGQAQRVGVARALGADPEVLLMDEPFGAIDPITRDRLQNEFLRLQGELRKTIVFVTHDVDEAIKMGDRIAILGQRSQLAQLDTPERILALPANDFVDDFIGSGSTLKGLHFERVRNVELADWPVVRSDADRSEALAQLMGSEEKWLLVLDEQDRPVRWVNEAQLARTGTQLSQLGAPVIATVEPQATLHDALEEMLSSNAGTCVVIDGRGVFQGVIAAETLTGAVARMRAEAKRHYEELATEERLATMAAANGGASR